MTLHLESAVSIVGKFIAKAAHEQVKRHASWFVEADFYDCTYADGSVEHLAVYETKTMYVVRRVFYSGEEGE